MARALTVSLSLTFLPAALPLTSVFFSHSHDTRLFHALRTGSARAARRLVCDPVIWLTWFGGGVGSGLSRMVAPRGPKSGCAGRSARRTRPHAARHRSDVGARTGSHRLAPMSRQPLARFAPSLRVAGATIALAGRHTRSAAITRSAHACRWGRRGPSADAADLEAGRPTGLARWPYPVQNRAGDWCLWPLGGNW